MTTMPESRTERDFRLQSSARAEARGSIVRKSLTARRLCVIVVIFCALHGRPEAVRAHSVAIADVLIILKADGTYQIDIGMNVDDVMSHLVETADPAEAAAKFAAWAAADVEGLLGKAREFMARHVRVRFDGARNAPSITFPELRIPSPAEATSVLGQAARLTGPTPEEAKEFTFGLSQVVSRMVQLTVLDQKTAGGVKYLLRAGEDSPPYRLGEPTQTGGRVEIVARYLVVGFEHILPKGLDHILFVLGLFLLSAKLRPLLWQVTAFTVAHSVTLGLSMYGVVSLPSRVVETLIALSITYVALENLLTSELKPWRPAVVFGFGLLHGLGFAGVLRELGLPPGEFASSLIAFNVGVELGQLSVVLLAYLTVGWFRRKRWYRSALVLPLSALIALTGFYWSMQRAFYGR